MTSTYISKLKDKFKPVLMQTAYNFASLSTAQRKQVGAIIADENGRILVTAYNGTISGSSNICEESTDTECNMCTAGHILNEEISTLTTCNNCDYEGMILKTKDEVIHGEQNLICYAAKHGIAIQNTIMFVTLSPCVNCAKLIIQSGIKEVYYSEDYRDLSGVEFLKQYIKCEKLDIQ